MTTHPVFLPGKFHKQRSLVGYHTWGCKEMDMAKLCTHIPSEKRDQNFEISHIQLPIILILSYQSKQNIN